jgi:hypothetical protein
MIFWLVSICRYRHEIKLIRSPKFAKYRFHCRLEQVESKWLLKAITKHLTYEGSSDIWKAFKCRGVDKERTFPTPAEMINEKTHQKRNKYSQFYPFLVWARWKFEPEPGGESELVQSGLDGLFLGLSLGFCGRFTPPRVGAEVVKSHGLLIVWMYILCGLLYLWVMLIRGVVQPEERIGTRNKNNT